MPIYEYKCADCRSIQTITDSRDGDLKARADAGQIACTCGGVYKRRFSFTPAAVMHEHWNPTVGGVVSSHRQFKSELRRLSEVQEARTGIPTNLAPIDHEELRRMAEERYGDAGLREQHDGRVARGEAEPTGKMVF